MLFFEIGSVSYFLPNPPKHRITKRVIIRAYNR